MVLVQVAVALLQLSVFKVHSFTSTFHPKHLIPEAMIWERTTYPHKKSHFQRTQDCRCNCTTLRNYGTWQWQHNHSLQHNSCSWLHFLQILLCNYNNRSQGCWCSWHWRRMCQFPRNIRWCLWKRRIKDETTKAGRKKEDLTCASEAVACVTRQASASVWSDCVGAGWHIGSACVSFQGALVDI